MRRDGKRWRDSLASLVRKPPCLHDQTSEDATGAGKGKTEIEAMTVVDVLQEVVGGEEVDIGTVVEGGIAVQEAL